MDQDLSGQSIEIINLYKQHVPAYLTTLREAVEAGDTDGISFHAHKMCSAMKSVGKLDIAALLDDMQRPGVALDDCRSLFAQVEGLVNESLAKFDNG